MQRSHSATHRLHLLVMCLATPAAFARGAVAEDKPYEARVVAAGASVQSGPGENFYPTDTLAQGDVVEVYREKPGGWLAIRPPANSFSWIVRLDLERGDDGIAEVIHDEVASRIGSRLDERHNAVQVRLRKGETIEVLDEATLGGETWCKIAPPAGEFRWIQASLVERIGGVQTASAETTSPASLAKTESNQSPASSASSTIPSAAPAPPLIPSQPAPVNRSAPAASSPTPIAAGPPATGLVADGLVRDLSAIELRLSRMVAAPVNLWNTERLERDTTQLLTHAKTVAERDAVQVTLAKIQRFAEIGRRNTASAATVVQADPAASPASPAPANVAAAVPQAAPAGGQFDGVGILRPVVSRRPGAPQFALVDERGQVLTFVTPTPDTNLQPYLGHKVGVVGNRGYIAEFNRAHVTAARVQPLNDRVLR